MVLAKLALILFHSWNGKLSDGSMGRIRRFGCIRRFRMVSSTYLRCLYCLRYRIYRWSFRCVLSGNQFHILISLSSLFDLLCNVLELIRLLAFYFFLFFTIVTIKLIRSCYFMLFPLFLWFITIFGYQIFVLFIF